MRAALIVLDSVGIGGAPDAAQYGDEVANTLGHILQRQPELRLPHLDEMGLSDALARNPDRAGWMCEASAGKDTTTGHWEMAGVVLTEPFATFDRFPDDLLHAIEAEAGVSFLGNFPASGTAILESLGAEHLRTGSPILYTSADSVMQIAAHEERVPIETLYRICEVARRHCDPYRIGRVIARPFRGVPGNFERTSARHDFSMQPPPTVLNALESGGIPVFGIGKIGDIFAGAGITHSEPTRSNSDGMTAIAKRWKDMETGLLFANLVDFDMLFGHRRDVIGYARALEEFDRWLGGFLPQIEPDDLLIITADHGNDPTFKGSDHTREQTPLLVRCGKDRIASGQRETFADVAATLARFFRLATPWPVGKAFL
jgi:phosphopentomutase